MVYQAKSKDETLSVSGVLPHLGLSYIPTGQGFGIIDLYTRLIIAWRLSRTLEAKFVVECIEEARRKRRGAKPLIFHTDRGSQYVSKAYQKAVAGIRASYSQKASPWQNACIESFHALIKRECLNRVSIRDYDHAYRLVFAYIEAFYNTVRSHSHCNYLSPQ
ncbi:MAG: integrase core domain-containing protein [Eubacteriales bacterium]|nr:integrase core domain-containing protein [Eubacteriales bacterium]